MFWLFPTVNFDDKTEYERPEGKYVMIIRGKNLSIDVNMFTYISLLLRW